MKHSIVLHFESEPKLHIKHVDYTLELPSGKKVSWTSHSRHHGLKKGEVFSDTKASRALWLALLRLKQLPSENREQYDLLQGGKGSAAYTLAQAITHAKNNVWMETLFDASKQGGREGFPNQVTVVTSMFNATNPNVEDKLPVRIMTGGASGLNARSVTIYLDEALAGREELALLECTFEKEFGSRDSAVRVSGSLPTTDQILIGRDSELEAIQNEIADGKIRILQVVGGAGLGKTGLAAALLRQVRNQRNTPVERIFTWSFYRQGYSPDALQSIWPFREALTHLLGIKIPPKADASEVVDHLLNGLRQQPTLLVLDGVEALLDPGSSPGQTEFRVDVVPGLLRGILGMPEVFCLFTSRREISFGPNAPEELVRTLKLSLLSHDASRNLLSRLGVDGAPGDLEKAVNYCGGSPLLLRLLVGLYRVERASGTKALQAVLKTLEQSKHWTKTFANIDLPVTRMMRSHLKWLAGTPELALLRLASLFDRIPDDAAMQTLLASPEGRKAHVTSFPDLGSARWQTAAKNLRKYQLAGEGEELALNLHPITQSFFSHDFRQSDSHAWEHGHLVLRDHYSALPQEDYPETLDEMAPLLTAVYHGCLGQEHEKTYQKIVWPRIARGFEAYLLTQLGGVQDTLSFLSSFFEKPWQFGRRCDLSPESKGAILTAVGHTFRLRDDLRQSAALMKAAEKVLRHAKDPLMHSATLCHLTRLFLISGRLYRALVLCSRLDELMQRFSAAIAIPMDRDIERGWFYLVVSVVASVLLAAGNRTAALEVMAKATGFMSSLEPGRTLLPSLAGAFHAPFMIETGGLDSLLAAIERGEAEYGRQEYEVNNMTAMVKGQAWLEKAIQDSESSSGPYARKAKNAVEEACTQALNFERNSLYAQALLLRARWHSHFGEELDFLADRNQAMEYAKHFDLRLLQTDIHLHASDHFVRIQDNARAEMELRSAKDLIRVCGYKLREPEVQRLEGYLEA